MRGLFTLTIISIVVLPGLPALAKQTRSLRWAEHRHLRQTDANESNRSQRRRLPKSGYANDDCDGKKGKKSTTVEIPDCDETRVGGGPQLPSSHVTGKLYEDENGDGTQGQNEPNNTGIEVKVIDDAGNSETDLTDEFGNYEFWLYSGNYSLIINGTHLPFHKYIHIQGSDDTNDVDRIITREFSAVDGGTLYFLDGFKGNLSSNDLPENQIDITGLEHFFGGV